MQKIPLLIMVLFYSLSSVAAVTVTRDYTWQEGQTGPAAREHNLMWVDQANDKLFVAGGWVFTPFQGAISTEVWSLDLKTSIWAQIPMIGNMPSPDGRGVSIPGTGSYIYMNLTFVLFGQQAVSSFYRLNIQNGIAVWKELAVENLDQELLGRDPRLSSLIYNPNDQRLYSLCYVADCEVYSFEITAENTLRMAKVSVEGEKPSGRIGYAYGFDPASNVFVMSGGQDFSDPAATAEKFFSETWIFDFATFKWRQIDDSLQGRRNPCFSFDTQKHTFVVWGGTADGVSAIDGVNSLDLSQATPKWTTATVAGITARASCVGAYYENGEKVLMGFGNTMDTTGEMQTFADLWSFSF